MADACPPNSLLALVRAVRMKSMVETTAILDSGKVGINEGGGKTYFPKLHVGLEPVLAVLTPAARLALTAEALLPAARARYEPNAVVRQVLARGRAPSSAVACEPSLLIQCEFDGTQKSGFIRFLTTNM